MIPFVGMTARGWRRLVALMSVGVAYACAPAADAESAAGRGADARAGWVELVAVGDPDNGGAPVRIALDTLGIRRLRDGGSLVWLETRHTRPRRESGRPFDRELLRFVLRCATLGDVAHRRVSATLLDGERPPVYQEAVSVDAAQATPWREARPGTADHAAFVRACTVVRDREAR